MTYGEEVKIVSTGIVYNELHLKTEEDGAVDEIVFYYDNGKLTAYAADGSTIALEPKNILADVEGVWEGGEDYSGMTIPYTVTVNADGTVSAVCDMFGTEYQLTLVSLDNKLVLSYMGAMTVTLLPKGESLVGTGIMGGALTLTPHVDEADVMTFDKIAGEWHATEEFYGYIFNYVFVINEDGTGSAEYSSVVDGAPVETTVFDFDKYVIENNKLILNYQIGGMDYDPITFTLSDGKLSGVGPMGTTLTLEKQAKSLALEDLAGNWAGTESGEYGNYNYAMTLAADGKGTISYVDEAGAYPSGDMEITGTVIEGNEVTISYMSWGTPYTLVLTYEDGKLSGAGIMMGTLTLNPENA